VWCAGFFFADPAHESMELLRTLKKLVALSDYTIDDQNALKKLSGDGDLGKQLGYIQTLDR
jgi:hypothetical protein